MRRPKSGFWPRPSIRAGYRIDVVACFRQENMPEQTHEQLKGLGVDVDRIPYTLSFEDNGRLSRDQGFGL